MKTFKITKKQTWNKNGVQTNWIKYMVCETEKEVIAFYGKENILKIEIVK